MSPRRDPRSSLLVLRDLGAAPKVGVQEPGPKSVAFCPSHTCIRFLFAYFNKVLRSLSIRGEWGVPRQGTSTGRRSAA